MVPECSCDAAQLKRPLQGRRTKHADGGRALTSQGRAARVFVNGPFDDDYVRVFQAIVFAIHDLGFQARHALIDDGEVPGGENIEKRYAFFEAKLPASAEAAKISMKEVRSWKYVNDVQAILAAWIRDNPSPV